MPEELTHKIRQAVVQDIAQLTMENYVFPDLGQKIAQEILAKLERGGYDHIGQGSELALALTGDLLALSNDRHWSVTYDPRQSAENADPETEDDEERMARWLVQARRRNFGFEKVERLRGNIGYIDLHGFAPTGHPYETAVAAMSFVANCDALIFDLRQNHGGYPSMVQLITSYLFDPEPRHINTFYYRPSDEIQQFWTFPHLPGKRLPKVPVYVLTSGATGSAAEEFSYNLKQMERATLIGETTAGAAHPVTVKIVQEHFQVRLPYGRPINPITGENWEGSGVEPHVTVPQEEALKTAHLQALARLAEACTDDEQKRDLAWETEIVERLYTPPEVDERVLARYTGHYGPRLFAVEDGALTYRHQAQPLAWNLVPLSETRFRLDDDLKFEFSVDAQGIAKAVTITYRDGRPAIQPVRTETP